MSKHISLVLAALASVLFLSGCHGWTHHVVHERAHHDHHGPHH